MTLGFATLAAGLLLYACSMMRKAGARGQQRWLPKYVVVSVS